MDSVGADLANKPASFYESIPLLRMVLRAFYPDLHNVVAEVVLNAHQKISTQKIAELLGVGRKIVHTALSELMQHKIIVGDTLKDQKTQQRNPTIFWYFDHDIFIKSLKYHFLQLYSELEEESLALSTSTEHYSCVNTECTSEHELVSVFDAIQNMQRMETVDFLCEHCMQKLKHHIGANSEEIANLKARVNEQLGTLHQLLRKINVMLDHEALSQREDETDTNSTQVISSDTPREVNVKFQSRNRDMNKNAGSRASSMHVSMSSDTIGGTYRTDRRQTPEFQLELERQKRDISKSNRSKDQVGLWVNHETEKGYGIAASGKPESIVENIPFFSSCRKPADALNQGDIDGLTEIEYEEFIAWANSIMGDENE